MPYRVLLRACLSLILAAPVRADVPVLNEMNQRLMELSLSDGTILSDSVPVYPVGHRWYVPLGEMAIAAGLAIEASPAIGTASGFVISENRRFELRVNSCEVEHDGALEQFPCEQAVVFEDDVYVTDELLARILPLNLNVNTFRSQIVITPRENLPIQSRRQRDLQAKQSKRTGAFDPGYPPAKVESEYFDGPAIDQQLSTGLHKSPTRTTYDFLHDTAITGELFGFDASGFVGGRDSKLDYRRYTLAKRDPQGGLLGPLAAKDIEFIDVTFPSLPMVGGGGVFRGFLLSSFSLTEPSQYGTEDFIGGIPAGWEVELYQNDILIERQISTNGQYEFKGIPLLFGTNRFRLVFFGPQGQRREEYTTYSINNLFLPPKTVAYRVGYGRDKRERDVWFVQLDKSLSRTITLTSAAAQVAYNRPDFNHYGVLGVRAFAKNLVFSSTGSVQEKGGYAWENALLGPLGTATVGGGYTRLNQYNSDTLKEEYGHRPEHVYKFNANFNLFSSQTVRATFESIQTQYADGYQNQVYNQKLSTRLGRFSLFNTIGYDRLNNGFNSEFSSIADFFSVETRATVGYDFSRLLFVALELQKRFSDSLSATFGQRTTIKDKKERYYGSLNKAFSLATLSATSSYEPKGDFSVGMILSYSFGREPRNEAWHMKGKAQALTGAASIFVFVDANRNGQYDEGEVPLANVEPTVNQGDSGVRTDKNGIAVLTGLNAYAPTDISIALRTLEDPFQIPRPRGLRFTPRPGKMSRLDFPVIVTAELSGMVRVVNKSRNTGRRGLNVELINSKGLVVQTALTEADGYYLFANVEPDVYQLRIEPQQLAKAKLKSDPEVFDIVVGQDGALQDTHDFELRRN